MKQKKSTAKLLLKKKTLIVFSTAQPHGQNAGKDSHTCVCTTTTGLSYLTGELTY